MNLNWSNRVIKYVLFVFNLLFVISGIIMIGIGVSVKAYYTDYDIFLSQKYFSLPNLLIAIGSLIFFISFFGCCGAIRESWFMIFVFSILLALIFVLEFSAGIAGYVLRDDTVAYLTDKLQESMHNYKFNDPNVTKNTITGMWDYIQGEFECCGANGPQDWPNIRPPLTPSTGTETSVTSSVMSTTSLSPGDLTTATSTSDTPQTSNTDTVALETGNHTRRRRAADATSTTIDPNINYDLPNSCCKTKYGTSGTAFCNLNNQNTSIYYSVGCVEGFGDFLKAHAVTLGGAGIAIALIQLFGVIFACHLARQLKHGFYST